MDMWCLLVLAAKLSSYIWLDVNHVMVKVLVRNALFNLKETFLLGLGYNSLNMVCNSIVHDKLGDQIYNFAYLFICMSG